MQSHQIAVLLEWCGQNEIWIDPRIRLHHDIHTGVGVFASDVIQDFSTVAKIPKDRVLSSRSCSFSDVLENFVNHKGHDATLLLSLAVCLELQLGRSSQWWGYLESLPKSADIALFWGADGRNDKDAHQAIQWFRGTEMERYITAGQLTTLPQLELFYRDLMGSEILNVAGAHVSLQDFRDAYSLVASRAFKVDAYHVIAMVPVADAFNHVEENTVHLETDYFVCHRCGSLNECSHDDRQRDDRRQAFSSQSAQLSLVPDICEMVTNSLILPGDEIFNSYDHTMNNARLMMQYGFMLEGNSNDRIEWKPFEVDHALGFNHADEDDDDKAARLRLWEMSAAASFPLPDLNVDELLFDPRELDHTSGMGDDDSMEEFIVPSSRSDFLTDKNAHPAMLVCIGAYAQISQQLWLYLAFHRLPANMLISSSSHSAVDSTHSILAESVLKPLLKLLVDDDPDSQTALENDALLITARLIVEDLISLCQKKLGGMYMKDLSVQELGNHLDSIPTSERRTRMACMFSLNERLILDSCVGKWEDCRARIRTPGYPAGYIA